MLSYFQRFYEWISSKFQKRVANQPKADKEVCEQLLNVAKTPVNELLKSLNSSERGLTKAKVNAKKRRYGLNEIAHDKPPTWYMLFLKNFAIPFNILLIVLATVNLILGDIDAFIIISVMVSISIVLRFFQEFRSNKAAEKLKALVSTTATVIRRSAEQSEPKKYEVDIKHLVPGDIITLSAGDMIPADVRLISAKELYVDQSTLTGESLPVEKDESLKPDAECVNPVDMPNMCFMGTNVLNGTATAVIVGIGHQSYFGSMAQGIIGHRPLTSFDIGVNKVSWLLIQFMFVMVPIVFLLNGFTKGNWFDAFLFALSVAVGLTPEMLPMIITANLARGAVKMSKEKVVVKRLNSIQNFGAMDVLCTDKTGTLTQNKIILVKHSDIYGTENDEVLKYAYLNSFYQTGLKNLLDIAVLEHKDIAKGLENEYKKVDEIPFDFIRRRMTVVVEKNPDEHILICKGAVEEVFEICSDVLLDGSVAPFTEEIKQKANAVKDAINEDGMRVLAVAYKKIEHPQSKEYHHDDETNLILFGFVAFLDPPKHSATEAIEKLNEYNVQVKVLTGDNELVSKKICNWVHLKIDGILNGAEIEKMSDQELKSKVDQTTIFAKLNPLQKSRVIAALRANGHTVGYLGDGINDAPALHEADVGISVDTAVDIAKESADIIMLEKSLLFLGQGVIEGRRTFANIIKYIKMAVSSNFGNVFSVLGASAILPFLPMMPIQLLVQNLLYDISQITIPFDNVDEDFLRKPRKWDPRGIGWFMVCIGPLSSIFDYTTFALMWFYFGANSIEKQSLFQSGWFVEGLLSQTLIVHMIRTQKIPFIQSIASMPLLVTTISVMLVGIYIPFSFMGSKIGLQPLPHTYFYWLVLTLLAYCTLVQLVKGWFIKRFHYWL